MCKLLGCTHIDNTIKVSICSKLKSYIVTELVLMIVELL